MTRIAPPGLHVLSTNTGHLPPSKYWAAQNRARLCPECGFLLRAGGLVPVEFADRFPPRTRYFFQGTLGVGYIHDALIAVLGQAAVEDALFLADAIGPDGEPVKGGHVFWGREPLAQRGTNQVQTRTCSECHRGFYSAGGVRHVTPSTPVREIYEGFPGALVVSTQLLEKIRAELRSVRLRADRCEVLPAPLDGLGVFPPAYYTGVR
ncbi:MAG: hypothetical protein V4850_29420 [Myxococcota bacterium]